MRKRGKKLLAIMLAASMTLGQSGTLTAAQENAAEIIESVTFIANFPFFSYSHPVIS
ncbi:hypothetical protein ACTNES_00200 [Blautia sp. HCP3S3_D9]|uniref:hypothetical protein n=1 Tax=Blautia sp. HCP3S3_D9 TaxID=3438912 RepID=UPI003F8A24A2